MTDSLLQPLLVASVQLRETLRAGLSTLLEHQVPSPELAAELLLMHVTGRDRGFLHTYPETELSADATSRYFRLIAERTTGKPTQYITGNQEFWGLDFEVTPDVLIPRPETEHVVEAVLELAGRSGSAGIMPAHNGSPQPKFGRASRAPRIVDVGTGSGCIALALASELPSAEITAVDISRAALAVASRNAVRLGLSQRVTFLESDLLASVLDDGSHAAQFHFVVSNPPYVGKDEIDRVQCEVRAFEPRLAWGGIDEAEEIYRRLFPQALRALKPGGYVMVEVGYNMAERVADLLMEGWTEVEVRPDLAGIPRVVVARKAAS